MEPRLVKLVSVITMYKCTDLFCHLWPQWLSGRNSKVAVSIPAWVQMFSRNTILEGFRHYTRPGFISAELELHVDLCSLPSICSICTHTHARTRTHTRTHTHTHTHTRIHTITGEFLQEHRHVLESRLQPIIREIADTRARSREELESQCLVGCVISLPEIVYQRRKAYPP